MADGPGRNYEFGGFTPKIGDWTTKTVVTKKGKKGTAEIRDYWIDPSGKKHVGSPDLTSALTGQVKSQGKETVYVGAVPDKTKTVRVRKPTTYTPWKQSVNEFTQDSMGQWVSNPLWRNPYKQGSNFNGQQITYVKTPSQYSEPLDPSLRVNTDSEFLLGKNSADTSYNSDVNARQRNLDLTNLNYGESKMKLAQQRMRDLSGIDQRAARSGLAFSQGRLNARNRYETDFNDRAQQALAANVQANSQFYNQNLDADAVRRQAIDQVRQNVIGKLTERDKAEKIANPVINWATPDSKFQSLDQTTGRRYYVDPKTKAKVYG